MAGLGASPGDVVINGSIDVYNQCDAKDCNALDNFWRSLSNVTINVAGGTGCQTNTEFWAVSQAAPMRRVQINGGVSLMDYCSGGSAFSSGGYIADSAFTGGTIVNGSQQQFLVRNSSIDGWSNGVWNQVFSGVVGAPAQTFGQPGANPYTTVPTSPITQEEPFLYSHNGALRVFVPAVRHDSTGTSWAGGATAGSSLPISRFFIATPHTPVLAINLALALGKNLLLTPGVYNLNQTIHVLRPRTIVLGLGFPTLVPQHGIDAMQVATVPGVKLSGMIFDAGPQTSRALLRVGTSRGFRFPSRASEPVLVQDVFFRIGGATAGRAIDSLVVNSSDVILDDVWAWRADHGNGVGWTQNTARTGVVVNGDNVTAYGLFVEHYQGYEVVWNGQHGTDIFFQNEMPYDVPSQAAWQANRTTHGFPAFYVTPRVRSFQGYGLGSYSNFNQGVEIHASESFAVPRTPGVQLRDVLTRFLNGSGGIDSVVNGIGGSVTADNPGPANVISYP
ncbi:MAG: adenylyl cyclase [Nakamurella sp.]